MEDGLHGGATHIRLTIAAAEAIGTGGFMCIEIGVSWCWRGLEGVGGDCRDLGIGSVGVLLARYGDYRGDFMVLRAGRGRGRRVLMGGAFAGVLRRRAGGGWGGSEQRLAKLATNIFSGAALTQLLREPTNLRPPPSPSRTPSTMFGAFRPSQPLLGGLLW